MTHERMSSWPDCAERQQFTDLGQGEAAGYNPNDGLQSLYGGIVALPIAGQSRSQS